ncbi:MAG: OFA family MFS transporter, partial [Planctomycetota bacterium]
MTSISSSIDLTRATGSSARWTVLAGAVLVQLVLGTVYGYSIFWEPLEAKIFPTVLTQAQHDARVAAGQDVGPVTVVATEQDAQALRNTNQGYLKYAFSICILSFAVVMVIAGRVQDLKG